MLSVVVDDRIVYVAPDVVAPGRDLLNGQGGTAIVGHPVLQHAAHQRPVLRAGGLVEALAPHQLHGFRHGALHHFGEFPGDKYRLHSTVLQRPEQHGIVPQLLDIPQEMCLGVHARLFRGAVLRLTGLGISMDLSIGHGVVPLFQNHLCGCACRGPLFPVSKSYYSILYRNQL